MAPSDAQEAVKEAYSAQQSWAATTAKVSVLPAGYVLCTMLLL